MPEPTERRSGERRHDGERLATLETKIERALKDIAHIDQCVETIKRAIWLATGVIIGAEFIIRWLLKG